MKKSPEGGYNPSLQEIEKEKKLTPPDQIKESTDIKPEAKKETQENIKITVTFEQGKQGPICRKPSDGGAWVVLENANKVSLGTPYIVEISRVARSGKLRFARVIETVKAQHERFKEEYAPLIKQALKDKTKLTARYPEWSYQTASIHVTVGEEVVHLEVTDSRPWMAKLLFEDWLLFEMTDAAKQILEEAGQANQLKKEEGKKEQYEKGKMAVKKQAEWRAEKVIRDATLVRQFFQDYPEAKSWFKTDILRGDDPYVNKDEANRIYQDRLEELFKESGVDFDVTWNEVFDKAKYKAAELESDPRIKKEKENIMAMAAQPDSENGPLGTWPPARLEQAPDAGALIPVDGKWYVAVAGIRREGTKGNYGGLYARWVQVPENECKDW